MIVEWVAVQVLPWGWIILALALMLIDIITGVFKALKNGTFKSSIMREGLWHKLGFIMAIFVIALLQVFLAANQLPDGFVLENIIMDAPYCLVICIYIIGVEIGSIWENLSEINPKLIPLKDIVKKGAKSE